MKKGNKCMIKYKSDISSFESREDYLKEFRSESTVGKFRMEKRSKGPL
jgi:hypothetical protein